MRIVIAVDHRFFAMKEQMTAALNSGLIRTSWGMARSRCEYEVYGDYIERLEEDFWRILEYTGRDFVETKANDRRSCWNRSASVPDDSPSY